MRGTEPLLGAGSVVFTGCLDTKSMAPRRFAIPLPIGDFKEVNTILEYRHYDFLGSLTER